VGTGSGKGEPAGRVLAVCISDEKGVPKRAVDSVRLRADHGIEGDAHAGPWHRQVSLLSSEDIEGVRARGLRVEFGAFAENIVVEGLDLTRFGLGTVFRLGASAAVRISQIGKVCHVRCAIYTQTGDCIMPRLGLFARVVEGGEVRPGDEVAVLQEVPRGAFQAVILTLSSTASEGKREDTAGPAVQALLESKLGAHIYRLEILPDRKERIVERLMHYADGHSIDLILTVGGTGFSPDDVAPEATLAVVERAVPGFGEAMRRASLEKTRNAILSRATAGIRGRTLIVNLPGSERAALENLETILPALPHGLGKLRGDRTPCGDEGKPR
jgi:molybdopterin adenylyltransferase